MVSRISMSPPPDGVFVSTPRIVGWTERTYRLYSTVPLVSATQRLKFISICTCKNSSASIKQPIPTVQCMVSWTHCNTMKAAQKHFADISIFIFLNKNVCVLIQFCWNLFPTVQLIISLHWFWKWKKKKTVQKMTWHHTGKKTLPEPMMT